MMKSYSRIFIFVLLFWGPFFYSDTAFSISDASFGTPSELEVRKQLARNPKYIAAIEKVAVYLEQRGYKGDANNLREDFKNGKVYFDTLPRGVNAEIQVKRKPPHDLAVSDKMISAVGLKDGHDVPVWALTFVHEYIHMHQPRPELHPRDETPAWAAVLKENGRWIRGTLDEINRVDRNATLSPEERGERLQKLNEQLTDLYSDFQGTLNDIHDKTAKGGLYKGRQWEGVPPFPGTTDLEAIGKYAAEQVKIGKLIAMPISVKIDPRPSTAKVGDKIQLGVKLFNMPAGSKVRYVWEVSHGDDLKFRTKDKGLPSFSYVVDKPGQWKMSIVVHAADKDKRPIVFSSSASNFEDSITVDVEEKKGAPTLKWPYGSWTLSSGSFNACGQTVMARDWDIDVAESGDIKMYYGGKSSNVSLTGSGTVLKPSGSNNYLWDVRFVYSYKFPGLRRGQAGESFQVKGTFNGRKLSGTVTCGSGKSSQFSNVTAQLDFRKKRS